MKPFAIALVGLLAGLFATTTLNAQVYEWKDESGKMNYSDKPPVGSIHQQRTVLSAPAAAAATPSLDPAQKTAADRELEFRKRQREAQQNAEKQNKEQIASAQIKEHCTNARRQLQLLESGERISQRDDKGERYFLDDAQREQEIANVRRIVEDGCK